MTTRTAILAVVIVVALVGAVVLRVPPDLTRPGQAGFICKSHLRTLGRELLREIRDQGQWPSRVGGDLFTGLTRLPESPLTVGDFFCTGDPMFGRFLNIDSEPEEWDGKHCSYRGPDAVLLRELIESASSANPRIIACDLNGEDGVTPHHTWGVCVLYETGEAGFVLWDEFLGSGGEPVPVGPQSPDPRFRHLVK